MGTHIPAWVCRILIASIMEEYDKAAWEQLIARCEDVGVDAFEVNFSCPHGMPERKMGMAMGQDCDILEVCRESPSLIHLLISRMVWSNTPSTEKSKMAFYWTFRLRYKAFRVSHGCGRSDGNLSLVLLASATSALLPHQNLTVMITCVLAARQTSAHGCLTGSQPAQGLPGFSLILHILLLADPLVSALPVHGLRSLGPA